MRCAFLFRALVLALYVVSGRLVATPAPADSPRITQAFDAGWRFTKEEVADAEQPDFDDAAWRAVTLPHDWSIEGPFDETNPTGGAGAFLPCGIGWYRNTFTLPSAAQGKRVFVEFDGVMQNSDVWLNGVHLGHRPYGYVSFRYELTPHLNRDAGGTNVLVVCADTSEQPASRWYSGAGIYRHVRLVLMDPVHIEPWSTFVRTNPGTASDEARTVVVSTRVTNQGEARRAVACRLTLTSPGGQVAATFESDAQPVPVDGSVEIRHEFRIAQPARWDLDTPNLYHATVTVLVAGTAVDAETVTFGIRDAVFDSKRGFLLNGRPVKLLGVCLHHDGGAFGAAVPLAVWEQRLTALRTLGVNAIRTAHNPPDPGFLDLCDRMGFLVMDELFDCWLVGKNPYDYHLYFEQCAKDDLRDTVLRDRNHPSVVLYSAGNEIHDTRQEETAKAILRGLVTTFHQFDPTRPVTQALFRPNVSHDYTNGLADLLDVVGTNYRDPELLAAWRAKPTRKIIGTEQRHDRETWLALRDHPEEAGQFLWTGIDYLGEARRWPMIGNPSGLIDRSGLVKPLGRQRQSWWTTAPMVSITRRVAPHLISQFDPGYEPTNFPTRRQRELYADWTPANQQPHDENVEVYSNCETVELFLNGQSLGAKPLNADASPRVWSIPYAPGTLRAVARNGDKDVATDELRTAGTPARIVVKADRATVTSDWEDVVRVEASVVDAQGTLVPSASNLVSFDLDGPGKVVAVDNGDNASHESFQGHERHAYEGHCVAFIRGAGSAGSITIQATSENLEPGSVAVEATGEKR